jgi:hypothetical protein
VKKKLQVFISSTYTDMLSERQAAVEAILRAGHIPAGMELFAAGDESQLETIRHWIDDSDVFMLMLGGRYGSIEPKSGKSYIELEYEYAIEMKKPFFATVINDAYLNIKVKASGLDATERDNSHLLKAFRENVTKRICRFFGDTNELKVIIFESLARYSEYEELSGWIRGSDVVDPKATLDEVNRLQTENVELRKQLSTIEALVRASTATSQDDSLASTLSDDAKALLIGAKKSEGRIMYIRYMGGASIQTADRNFIEPYSNREEARWKAALDELRGNRLIEDVGYKGEIFQMTKLGYEVADEIEGKKE